MRYPERLHLANLPTPIQRLERISAEVGKQIFVWRDDLSDFVGSGNKIRKLEFILADALAKKATAIVTCGGVQSNHTRATAFLAKRLGLEVHLVLRKPKGGINLQKPVSGNLLLNQMFADSIRFIELSEYERKSSEYDAFLVEEAEKLRAKGRVPYLVPEGGSCPLGVFGYIHGAEEMATSWIREHFGGDGPDALFLALGSGGTLAGLYLGFERMGLSTDSLCAINVCDNREYFEMRVTRLIEDTCEKYHLSTRGGKLHIFDGHVGGGYAVASYEDLRFYRKLAQMEGLLLDPCYTGKAFQGMLKEIKKDPDRFGERVLFLHSGGAFANFNFTDQYQKALT